MADATPHRIVIRRKKRAHHGDHHGGAWKIAYADFVTAMMAFFLVMWLISLMPEESLKGIADYFRRPLIAPLSAENTSAGVIPGGGIDPERVQGNVRRSYDAPSRNTLGAAERQERRRFEAMKSRLDNLIKTSPVLKHFRPQLLLDITTEGLRIQIIDTNNRPMFATSRAEVQPHMRAILRELAPLLNEMPNRISIAGHTDASQYMMGEQAYSNWELSSDRANASRRELVAGGLQAGKVMRTMGLADSMSVVKDDPYAALNRRISLVVLNKQTEQRIERENAAAAQTDMVAGQANDVVTLVQSAPTARARKG